MIDFDVFLKAARQEAEDELAHLEKQLNLALRRGGADAVRALERRIGLFGINSMVLWDLDKDGNATLRVDGEAVNRYARKLYNDFKKQMG